MGMVGREQACRGVQQLLIASNEEPELGAASELVPKSAPEPPAIWGATKHKDMGLHQAGRHKWCPHADQRPMSSMAPVFILH